MSIYEYDEEKHMRQTREEGEQRLLKLISCMSASGEVEKIPELSTNEQFLKEMFKKYNL